MIKHLVAHMQPSVGRSIPHKGAAKAYYRASVRDDVSRIELEQSTSSLPRCFNMMLCEAMNLARKGTAINRLAMCHDDVVPEGQWLDAYLDLMDETGAEMITGVIPIKNHLGVTSTAVDNSEHPWTVRRLCMKEIFDLPETFGAEDVPWAQHGQPLLGNSGLWVCKFDMEWAKKFADPDRRGDGQSGFRFNNRIVQDPFTGDYMSEDICEDWDFARQLASFGMKVMATRKVKIIHEQPHWHNHFAWGQWATDMAYLQYTGRQNKAPLLDGFHFPFPMDVEGWLTPEEGSLLAKLAEGKRVLEIGSYCGRSTICLAQTAQSVFAVDPFDGRATSKPQPTLSAFMENLSRYGVLPKVTACQGASRDVLPQVDQQFDLAFIDGAHDRASVLEDAELAMPHLAPDGILAFHDYGRPGDEGVTEAVNQLMECHGAEMVERVPCLAAIRW
jgi:MMP 1-O-methyltransferase